ncbi:MAG: transcription-repair coupling factor [Steroidobacteraceae bacterium]
MFSPIRPNRSRRHVEWHGLHGSATSLAIAQAAVEDSRLYLVIAPTVQAMEETAAELRFFCGTRLAVRALPDWEILPYDLFSPHADLVSERLATLAWLLDRPRGILLVAAETLLLRLPPRNYLSALSFQVRTGDTLDTDAMRTRLVAAGYLAVGQVRDPGEFAMRGSLLDLYPMGSTEPLRIDLLDRQIDAIRQFDPDTQRSLEKIDTVKLLPGREFPLDEIAIRDFRQRYRRRFEGDPSRSAIYRGVGNGIAPPGIEFYLPLFFETPASLFDHLPDDAVVVTATEALEHCASAWRDLQERYEERRHDIERPILAPHEIALEPQQIEQHLAERPQVTMARFKHAIDAIEAVPSQDFHTRAPIALTGLARPQEPLANLVAALRDAGQRTLLVAESPGRRELLLQMLAPYELHPPQMQSWQEFTASPARNAIMVAEQVRGLAIAEPALRIVTEQEIFGARARQQRRRRRSEIDPAAILRDLQSLIEGAPVVHQEYGVGRYRGLKVMTAGGEDGEFLVLEYRDGDLLYVPVHSLQFVSRYTGSEPDHAPLHKLGSGDWQRARRRAAEQIRDVAAELLDLHARRQLKQSRSLAVGDLEYNRFADGFPFEETPDQAAAIAAVRVDLAASKPMDRVICGDVGFGKTEVAMRAAFIACQAGCQVALLVPTTLLAEQHAANFRDRFADWPIRIEALSRFRGRGDADRVIAGVASGAVDIVIATHKLLHAQVQFRNLGLVIVDEEHRFGVRDKERLKALRAEVHFLTLTATPIPRTLNLALGGLRDLSLITTPPVERLAIKTFVLEWHDATIREAALRELRRGGQIYFVHNEVRDMEKVAMRLRNLIPEADVRVGHGQMRERDLEQLMIDFYHRRFNLLLATTIIESGIDVPTANTIMIDRADRFGLAQLHQLRGRVGRSHHRAYAYLLTPPMASVSSDAQKRLAALESLEELGAGFVLATHDLEIRGAGELLGEAQSGNVSEIGLSLYLDLLGEAVAAARAGRTAELDRPLAAPAEVELHVPALLPEEYVGDVHVRLGLYKRIASAAGAAELDELGVEIVDRFGAPLPPAAANLLRAAALTLRARRLGMRRMELGPQGGYLSFTEHSTADPAVLVRLASDSSGRCRFDGPLKLRINAVLDSGQQRFALADELLTALSGDD